MRQGSAGTTMAQLNLGPSHVKHAPTHPVFGRVNPRVHSHRRSAAFDPNPHGDSF